MNRDIIDIIVKGNPYHGKDGRFTTASGATSMSINAMDSQKTKMDSIKCKGPQDTKRFISEYMDAHPEVKSQVGKYMGVLDKVKNFAKDNPNAEDGTYSATTGEMVTELPPYCVTFHQNNTASDPYGAYTSEDYAAMCAIAINELKSADVYIGYFGNPEVSFSCDSKEAAQYFAVEHNQNSIFDSSTFNTIYNKAYVKELNPIEGID